MDRCAISSFRQPIETIGRFRLNVDCQEMAPRIDIRHEKVIQLYLPIINPTFVLFVSQGFRIRLPIQNSTRPHLIVVIHNLKNHEFWFVAFRVLFLICRPFLLP